MNVKLVYPFATVFTKLLCWACLSLALIPILEAQIIHFPTASVLMRCDLEVTTTSFMQSCDGAEVCLQIEGGTAPYNIIFSNDDGTNPSPTEDLTICFPNLAPGNYSVKVTDAADCSQDLTINIPAVDYYIPADIEQVSCHGAGDGAIDLNIEIDLAPLYYSWEGPDGFTAETEDIDQLEAGVYAVSISTTDEVCVGIGSWVISEPEPIQIDIRLEQPECGQPNGCVYVSGGTAPYYVWVFDQVPDIYAESSTGTISDWSDLDPALGIPYDPNSTDGPAFCAEDVADGVYYVFVVDRHFCYAWERVEIEGNTPFRREVEVRQGGCGSTQAGSICFKIDGDTGPYATTVYPSVTDEAIIGDNGCFDNLARGVYELRTVDANGCVLVERFEINSPGDVEAKLEITSAACSAQVDACLYVEGGEQPYRIFVWYWPNAPFAEPQISLNADGEPLADGNVPTNDLDFGPSTSPANYRRCVEDITPGYYVIVVLDSNGCYDVIRTQTPSGTGLTLRTAVQDARCYGNTDGSVELKIDGGVAPYAIAISPNDYQIIDTDYILIDDLSAGTYQIKVEDRQGCSARTEVTIGEPSHIEANFEITSPTCAGQVDGCLTVYGGTFPYNIWVWRWDNITTVEPQVVFDDNGNPRIVDAIPTDQMDFGPNTAGVYRRCAEDIPAGHYIVLVVDAQRCYQLLRVTIPPANNGLELGYEVQPAGCNGEADGLIRMKISGGTPPYSITRWDGITQILDGNEITFEGLAAGTYSIKVEDANGCTEGITAEVPGGEGLETVLEFDPYGSYACVEVLNSTAPYAYQWWDLSSNASVGDESCVEDLNAGAYWVEVKDQGGCSAIDVFFIDERICQGGHARVSPAAIRSGSTTTFYLNDHHGDAIQWQFRTRNTDWLNIPGAMSETYQTPPMYAGSDRVVQVRALVVCANGDVEYSSTAEFKIYGHVALARLSVGLQQDRSLFDPNLQLAAQRILSSEKALQTVAVFPTISSSFVQVQFPVELAVPAKIWISDSTGKVLRKMTSNDLLTEVDVSSLLSGIYFLKIQYNEQLEVQRVVVP